MILGLQLYGPIACGKMGLTEMFEGFKKLGIARVEPCVTLDGEMDNPSFWTMEQCRENFSLIQKSIFFVFIRAGTEPMKEMQKHRWIHTKMQRQCAFFSKKEEIKKTATCS